MKRIACCALLCAPALMGTASPRPVADRQPIVQPGPVEPDWIAILRGVYGLDMTRDLANPVVTTVDATAGRFRKAGPGPVTFRPEMALGLEVIIRGGFYDPARADTAGEHELWSYQFKNTGSDIETGKNLPPTLRDGSRTEFDPGAAPFGLYVANDQFRDAVFSEPARVRARNPRLAAQPYKMMVYPYRDPATGKPVPHSYLIGWEYSTNDDFQDVVCRIENVDLIAP